MNTRLLGGLALGVAAGILAGLIGIGGGLIIVPALLFLFNLDQHTAQGTSLAVLLPPTGLLAFIEYYKAGHVHVGLAIMIALGALIGGYFGGAWAQSISGPVLRKAFAVLLAVAAVRMFTEQ